MRTRFRLRLCLIVIVIGTSGLWAAGVDRQRGVGPAPLPGQPAATPTPAPGTGLVLGRVVEGDTDRPVANVLVSVSMSGAPGAPGLPGAPPVPAGAFTAVQLITGHDGFFVVRNVPPGTFSFRATAQGYLPTQGLDSRRPAGSGHPLSLDDGAKVNNVTLRMWKMGVIAGRLVDEAGESFEGGQITAHRIEPGAQRRVVPSGGALTDDRGAFRISGLVPGDYLVCALFARHIVPIAAGLATQQAQSDAAAMAQINQSYMGSGAPPVAGSSGYRVGEYLLTSSAASRNLDPAPDAEGRLRVYSNACHGGADSVASATPIALASGEERTGVDMVTRLLPSLRVMGTVTGPRGPLPHVGVHLLPAGAEAGMSELTLKAASTVTDGTGAFGFIGVPAGAYSVRVVLAPRVESADAMMFEYQMMMEMGMPMPARPSVAPPPLPPDPTLHARMTISLTDSDVVGLSVQVREAARMTGQVMFDGASARPTADQLQRMRVDMRAVGGPSPDYFATPRGAIDASGQLRTTGIVPGRYLLSLTGAPAGWSVKSFVINGRDASAEPVEIGSADISGAIVTLTDRPVSITGTVRGATGGPDAQDTVILFPSDRARWTDLPASGRSSRMVRVTPTGGFTIGDLAAGQYFIVAIDDRYAVGWNDPKRLDALSRIATPVSIADAERRTIDLRTSLVR